MNRNRKKAVAASVAVGMTMVLGVSPVLAANTDISKEETVYVNAAADGTPEEITVSDWLKNSASSGDLSDTSDLKDIKNVKGDETFSQDGDKITWNTEDKDIYYQGTTTKDLPVSMEIKYYLNGAQINPDDLGGKSGHLKIEVAYKNNVKNKTKVGTKTTDLYAPFVMVTAMILPTDNFTNVTIDNGKVLSDGQRNIVVGVGMPGLADNLDLKSVDEDIDIDIPEDFTMEADVTDFNMSSTFTFALTDILDSLDTDDIDGLDDLKDSMKELTDAATELVDGSKELSDGASTLDEKYQEFDSGIGTLVSGVSSLNSGAATLKSGVSSYTSGVDTLTAGAKQYIKGSDTLTAGVKTYVNGAAKLQQGIKAFQSGLTTFTTGLTAAATGADTLNTKVADIVKLIKGKVNDLTEVLADPTNESSLYNFAKSTEAYAKSTGALADGVTAYIGKVGQVKALADQLNGIVNPSTEGGSSDGATQQIEDGLTAAQSAAASVGSVASTSATDQLNAAASAVSAAAGTGDALQGDAGTISAGLDSASSAIDILNGIDTSSMDEATAAAVNSAVQSAIGAISGGVATAQGGVASVQAHAEQVSGLNDQAAQVQAAASEVSAQNEQVAAVSEAASQIQAGISQAQSGLATLDASEAETKDAASQAIKELTKQIDGALTQLTDTKGNAEVAQLSGGAAALGSESANTQKLAAGANSIYTVVIPNLQTELAKYLGENCANLDTLASKVAELAKGISALKDGYDGDITKAVNSIVSGATELTKNNSTIKKGANKLQTSGKTLTSGANTLSANSSALNSGAGQLASGTQQLMSGTTTLSSGSAQVKSGIKSLSDGAKKLSDGTKEFDEEGIQKLSDIVDDDLQDILDRLDAICSDDNAYRSFSGKQDDMDGNVKFVIETAAIDNDSDK